MPPSASCLASYYSVCVNSALFPDRQPDRKQLLASEQTFIDVYTLMGGHGTHVVPAMHSGPPRLGVVNVLS
jgi:hypothetical protein